MFVSFFDNWEKAVWVDCTGHENCIHVEDVQFDPTIQDVILKEKKWVFTVEVVDLPPPPETEDAKKSRITLALITSEDPTSVDTEGVKWFDIDYCINQRFFGGDRGKEIGFTQRFAYLLSLTDLTEDQEAEKKLIIDWYEKKEQYKEFIKSLNTYEKPTVDPNI